MEQSTKEIELGRQADSIEVRFLPAGQYSKYRNPRRHLRSRLIKLGEITKSGRCWRNFRKRSVRLYKQTKKNNEVINHHA